MPIAQALIAELDHEAAVTRKVLARLPAEKYDWAPHAKSMTVRRLASHMATLPMWGTTTLATEKLDINPPGGPEFKPPEMNSPDEVLAVFDRHVAEFRAAVAASSEEAMLQPWSLLSGGQTIFTQPRVAVLRGMILKHMVHHRGQFSVYIRLLDLPVPSIYGPSADEQS